MEAYHHIPEDLVREILPRLPVKSLNRFRCVSKSWGRIISDPRFSLASDSNRQSLIVLYKEHEDLCNSKLEEHEECECGLRPALGVVENKVGQGFVITPLINDLDTFLCTAAYISRRDDDDRTYMVWASCKELLLLSCGEYLLLLNPWTRRFRKVLSYDPCYHLSTPTREIVCAGLCFDPSSDDYKVVIATKYWLATDLKVMVASFRNKAWKDIPFKYGDIWVNGPVFDEKIHWLVKTNHGDILDWEGAIIYFDPICDRFIEVPLPDEAKYIGRMNQMVGLGILDGCLALTWQHDEVDSDGWFIDVWIMKDYGVKESWTVLVKVPMCIEHLGLEVGIHVCQPALINKDGEVLLEVRKRMMMVYSPNDDSCKDARLLRKFDIEVAVTCEEGLYFPWNTIEVNNRQKVESRNIRLSETKRSRRRRRKAE